MAQGRSALFQEGSFREICEPIGHIFQFVIESGQLKIDREAWERQGKEIEKENAEAENKAPALPPGMNPNSAEGLRFQARLLEQKSRQLEEKAREVERLARAGPIPPLHLLFRKVQEKAMRHPAGFGFGGPGYSSHNGWVEFNSAFRGNAYRPICVRPTMANSFRLRKTSPRIAPSISSPAPMEAFAFNFAILRAIRSCCDSKPAAHSMQWRWPMAK